ncbi:MAG: biopolymer transporter ExbD [Luteolibacter sp.]
MAPAYPSIPLSYHACYLLVAVTWLIATGAIWRAQKSPVFKAVVSTGVIGTAFYLVLGGWMIAHMIWDTKVAAHTPIPGTAQTPEFEASDIRIDVLDSQRLKLNGDIILIADFESRLPAIRQHVPQDPLVEISASDDSSYESIERILNILSKSGLQRIAFQAGEHR